MKSYTDYRKINWKYGHVITILLYFYLYDYGVCTVSCIWSLKVPRSTHGNWCAGHTVCGQKIFSLQCFSIILSWPVDQWITQTKPNFHFVIVIIIFYIIYELLVIDSSSIIVASNIDYVFRRLSVKFKNTKYIFIYIIDEKFNVMISE